MNIAIQITCLLIEAAEDGIELKADGDRLKIRAGAEIDAALRGRLRIHQPAIIERLNYEAAHPDPFTDFINECCLFSVSEGMATPIPDLDETYLRWAERRRNHPASLVSLHKRLRCLGCQEVRIQGAPWWEHIGLTLGAAQSENGIAKGGNTDD